MVIGWAALSDVVPLYPLYALLFADTGLSTAQISALFVIWSVVGFVAEVPSGALADRFSRRGALVSGGVLQAAGYAMWVVAPGFLGFAAGFALWGLGGALTSGALEALLYDGLAADGEQEHYGRVYGWINAVGLLAQIPTAVLATVLFSSGGYQLVGWVSVGTCLAAAMVAYRLPEVRARRDGDVGAETIRYFVMLKSGVMEAVSSPTLRIAVIAVATLTGVEAVEEYFPLLADDWGLKTETVPFVMAAIALAGAAGAAFGGVASRWRPLMLAGILVAAGAVFGAAGIVHAPIGLLGVALFYGLYQVVQVVVNARLQDRIQGAARATITSVASLATEVAVLAFYALWAFGQVVAVAVTVMLLAVALPGWLRAGERVGLR